jgi:hypothetical protein
MPVNDDDEVFVSSVIAVHPSVKLPVPERTHTPEWTANYLLEARAIPVCNYIKPQIGFGRSFAQHLAAIKFMAQTDCELGHPREWFRTPDEVQPRNLVWIYSMELALGAALITPAFLFRFHIEGLSVHLNAKSLTTDERHFFGSFLKNNVPRTAKQVFEAGANNIKAPLESRKWSASAAERMTAGSVEIEWDDDPGFTGDRGLVWLVHSLARNTFAEVRRRDQRPGMTYEMARTGINKFWSRKNVTRGLERPRYSRWRHWEETRGVKIPHNLA